jgi:hypothetical protein
MEWIKSNKVDLKLNCQEVEGRREEVGKVGREKG